MSVSFAIAGSIPCKVGDQEDRNRLNYRLPNPLPPFAEFEARSVQSQVCAGVNRLPELSLAEVSDCFVR